MNTPNDAAGRTWQQRLLSPWGMAIIVLAAVLAFQGWQARGERALHEAINNHPVFATPALPLEFSRTIQYDPLSFVGRGARAGFWEWTPEGLNLTAHGGVFFRLEEGKFISQAPAGRRRLTRIRSRAPQGSGERIDFFYEWVEISPVAVALLRPAPVPGQEFLASAVVVGERGGWRVESLEARDYEEPLARLQEIASGVLR